MKRFCGRSGQKTDSAGESKSLLLESWNPVTPRGHPRRDQAEKLHIPDSVLQGSKLKSWDGLGAPIGGPPLAKYLLINDLAEIEGCPDIGETRALHGRMSAFHMTSCGERRARGKGLARIFSQFVPTCL